MIFDEIQHFSIAIQIGVKIHQNQKKNKFNKINWMCLRWIALNGLWIKLFINGGLFLHEMRPIIFAKIWYLLRKN